MHNFSDSGLIAIVYFLLIVGFAYLLGSLSSGILVCKLMGLPDPRSQGSGNIGATNVLRIKGGKLAALLTLLGDMLKGVIPVLIAIYFTGYSIYTAAAMIAAFLGHLYPIFYGFKGGKGVATALGSIITVAWPVGISMMVTWLAVALLTRYSSLAAIIAFILAPIDFWFFTHDINFTLVSFFITILILYKHKDNIKRLKNGTESKIGNKASR